MGIPKKVDRIGWGPFVQGDRFNWDLVSREQKVGDQKSGDQMGLGPNALQPLI